LRSPLTSIKGYVDLMMGGELGEIPEHLKEYFDVIALNSNRLSMLIDDILDLTRLESGKLPMNFGKVDVKYLCDYVRLMHKPQAEQKHQTLELHAPSGLMISGDMERLVHSLGNLVSNAIKYTPEKGWVKIEAVNEEGAVRISVQDNGMGISEDHQQKLFQKFFRVKNKATRNIGGTGLGLCIAKSIVEAHEGTIAVNSKVGEGSTFTIHLPIFEE